MVINGERNSGNHTWLGNPLEIWRVSSWENPWENQSDLVTQTFKWSVFVESHL
jgi:hypothetical protein